MINKITQKWRSLPTRKQQIVLVGSVCIVVLGGVWLLGDNTPDNAILKGPSEEDRISVLNTHNAREAGIEGLSSEVRSLSRNLSNLSNTVEGMEKRSGNSQQDNHVKALSNAVHDLRTELHRLQESRNNDKAKGEESGSSNGSAADMASNAGAMSVGSLPRPEGNDAPYGVHQDDYSVPTNPMAGVTSLRSNGRGQANASESASDGSSSDEKSDSSVIRVVSQMQSPGQSETDDKSDDNDAEDQGAYLPAGSIITGVLLTGMDAPTGNAARNDPFPATIRINKEAILPNRFRADVKECFMLVSGHGDLSSERAYLRSETISCVRDDGGVIEAGLKGYATGEDGKAGIRGRLVSKQGSLIAKSLMAGFMSGAAEAFDVNPIPVLDTDGGSGTQKYSSNFNPKMFQGAAASGASSALDRIAQFYTDMAEGMYPVIEIGAGREVDVIVTKGTRLKIQG